MAGFQLWVNLAAKDKMTAPAYRDVPPADVPAITLASGVHVRVIAGQALGVAGAVSRPTTEPLVLDIGLPAGGTFDAAVPAGHNAFVYVYGGGTVEVGGQAVESERMAILANDASADGVRLTASGAPARVLLVAGAVIRPTTEPLVLDITLPAGTSFDASVPAGHNAFVYVYGGGTVDVGGQAVESACMAILANDASADGVRLTVSGVPARVLLVAGAPLSEPIAQYGPFVMNTTEQIHQAVADFQRGALAV